MSTLILIISPVIIGIIFLVTYGIYKLEQRLKQGKEEQ